MHKTKQLQIAELMDRLSPQEELNSTYIDAIKIHRSSQDRGKHPLCYNQGIIFIGQGTKVVTYNEKAYTYNPENYLVLPVILSAECEAFATPQQPILAMLVDINLKQIQSISSQLHKMEGFVFDEESVEIPYTENVNQRLQDCILRILQVLQSPTESEILGDSLLYELYYLILANGKSAALHALTMKDSNVSRIEKALQRINNEYDQKLSVKELAEIVYMSESSFHRIFNSVTATTPIQYIKNIRLLKAKDLLVSQEVKVNEVALKVGYENVSQFSREFKRYFGQSPSEIA
jgi:AraC-like DNA-binding protein